VKPVACDKHELRFLIGRLIAKGFPDSAKTLGFSARSKVLWQLVKLAGNRGNTDCGVAPLEDDFIKECQARFKSVSAKNSICYQVGDTLVGATRSPKGALVAPYRFFKIGRMVAKLRFRPSVLLEKDVFPVIGENAGLDLAEIETEPGLLDMPGSAVGDDQSEGFFDLGAVETEPGLLQSKASLRADRIWLEQAIENLGTVKTGVGIQNLSQQIAAAIRKKDLARCRAAFEGAGELAGMTLLADVIVTSKLGANTLAYIARVLSVLRLSEQPMDLGKKNENPVYEPDARKLFYAIHMRGPYISNGYTTRTYTVMKSLKVLGYDPEGVTRLGFPSDLAKFRTDKIPEIEDYQGLTFNALPDSEGGQLLRPVDNLINAYAEKLVELGKKQRPHVLHAASNFINGLAVIIAARKLGIPSIYEVRGIWEITQVSKDSRYEHTRKYKLQRNLENLAVQTADQVITISEPLRDFVIEQGANPDTVFVVPNGVDIDAFKPQKRNAKLAGSINLKADQIVIGYIGSIVHYEGLDVLLKAVAGLPETILKKLKVVIVGDGAFLPQLKEQAVKLSIGHLCVFPGRVPQKDVRKWYSLVDITPFPRHSLPVTELVPPLKPYEAMAMKKAIIVSSVKALAIEIIDGETGLIFEKDNQDDLADKLLSVIKSAKLRTKLGRGGNKWVIKERSIRAIGDRLEQVYSSASS